MNKTKSCLLNYKITQKRHIFKYGLLVNFSKNLEKVSIVC